MAHKYEKLDVLRFGEHLIESTDLDPLYVALHRASNHQVLSRDQLKRFLVAYWCFYDVGASCFLSEAEGPDFWARMVTAARNDRPTPINTRWPRGHERRHFRGEQAVKAVSELMEKYFDHPEKMVDYIFGAAPSFKDVTARAREHRGFGPWIAFKVADMIDRVLGVEVQFSYDDAMYDNPQKGALLVYEQNRGDIVKNHDDHRIQWAVEFLREHFGHKLAPPDYTRCLNLQEYETIFCKWKSHLSGHYPLNNDIREIQAGLEAWAPVSQTADRMCRHMPQALVGSKQW